MRPVFQNHAKPRFGYAASKSVEEFRKHCREAAQMAKGIAPDKPVIEDPEVLFKDRLARQDGMLVKGDTFHYKAPKNIESVEALDALMEQGINWLLGSLESGILQTLGQEAGQRYITLSQVATRYCNTLKRKFEPPSQQELVELMETCTEEEREAFDFESKPLLDRFEQDCLDEMGQPTFEAMLKAVQDKNRESQ